MYTIHLLRPIFLTDHSRFEQSRNEKCKLEKVWILSLLISSLAFTPSFICLRPIRSSFRLLNRNSWQFAQFPVTRETIQKPIDKFLIYKFLFVRRHVYKPNEQSQQDRRTRIHVSYCSIAIVDCKLWFKMIDPLTIRLQRVWWDDCIEKEAFDLSECTSAV